jgi:small subunit ribosomal protein S9
MIKIVTSGKRKTAVARAILTEGTGKIIFKNQNPRNLNLYDKLKLAEPVRIAESMKGKANFDVKIEVSGGGEKGQVEAARLALAKAISQFYGDTVLTKAFLEYDRNMLIADVRRKEAYKPGDSKARRKRQTSYR